MAIILCGYMYKVSALEFRQHPRPLNLSFQDPTTNQDLFFVIIQDAFLHYIHFGCGRYHSPCYVLP